MPSRYRVLFSPPGAIALSLSGLLARFPMGMLSIAATMMVTALHGSYTLAGTGGAAVLVTCAILGPQEARLADRYGQAKVCVPAALVAALGGIGVVLSLHAHAPAWAYLACCVVSGVGPSAGSLVRARWAWLHAGDEGALHTAYASEGVLDELSFVLGPLVVMAAIAAWSAEVAYLAAQALAVVGIVLLGLQRRTAPPVAERTGRQTERPPGILSQGHGLPVLVVVLTAIGMVFGAQEITTVGFAQALHHRGQSGMVLASYALGSCLSGILLGLWTPRGNPVVRLRFALAAMALLLAPLTLVHSLHQAAAVLFVAGFATAPTISTAMNLVRELVPPRRLTEGFTWTTTGLTVGISLGTAIGGRLVDHAAAGTGYVIPSLAAALALLLTFAGATPLRSTRLRSVPALRSQPAAPSQESVPADAPHPAPAPAPAFAEAKSQAHADSWADPGSEVRLDSAALDSRALDSTALDGRALGSPALDGRTEPPARTPVTRAQAAARLEVAARARAQAAARAAARARAQARAQGGQGGQAAAQGRPQDRAQDRPHPAPPVKAAASESGPPQAR